MQFLLVQRFLDYIPIIVTTPADGYFLAAQSQSTRCVDSMEHFVQYRVTNRDTSYADHYAILKRIA